MSLLVAGGRLHFEVAFTAAKLGITGYRGLLRGSASDVVAGRWRPTWRTRKKA
jgi:hypothetical protein